MQTSSFLIIKNKYKILFPRKHQAFCFAEKAFTYFKFHKVYNQSLLYKIMQITKAEFEEELEKLKQASKNKIIVVEGPKDKKALESLGVKHIIVLRKPLYLVAEYIEKSGKDCILLLDLDKTGKRLYSILNHDLNQFGVRIDNRFREFLFRTRLRQIEGINRYFEKLE